MPVDVEKSFGEVVRAMEKLTEAFEQRVGELRKMGSDEASIKSLMQGAAAMKDSSGIYLAWARHFMNKLTETEGLEEDEGANISET
jgi:hypothetical protein